MATLARRLGFLSLVVYGIGDILGAGIYALVGKVIGAAGNGAWLSFILAATVAILTGFSYAEMTARFPVAGGAATFVRRAFPGTFMATLVGILVLGTGVVSASAVSVAFGGYLQEITPLNEQLSRFLIVTLLSFISFWGIRESARFNFGVTLIEFSGLMAVIAVGTALLFRQTDIATVAVTHLTQDLELASILSGVTIAFFAYIGFEDLSNLAEESINPRRDLPRAILIAIAVTTIIYLIVTVLLELTIPAVEIADSKAPLLLVFEHAGFKNILPYFSVVALLAVTNTGLVNLIMASRMMYGMANEGLLPKRLSAVHPRRQTPWVGVGVAYLAVLILVFTGGLKVLAQTSSLLILTIFMLVHISLIRVKRQEGRPAGLCFPVLIPVVGAILCLGLISQFPAEVFLRSTILLGLGILVWILKKYSANIVRRSKRR